MRIHMRVIEETIAGLAILNNYEVLLDAENGVICAFVENYRNMTSEDVNRLFNLNWEHNHEEWVKYV